MIKQIALSAISAGCVCVLGLCSGGTALAAPPASFQNEVLIASGLSFPTALEFLPDGRMLISEFTGRVVVVPAGASAIEPVPVLQLVNVIDEDATVGGERGLVNVIADPDFASNGYIYLFYTAGSPQRDRVSRFTMSGNTASLASELVIWQGIANSVSDSHHGGGLVFGPDGMLYISTGDNLDPNSVPDLSSDHGKLLRLMPDGTIPIDNPFHDGVGPNLDSIWAYGLRNPFRLTLDVPTGRVFIGDVGQFSVEEINLATRGANYGWPQCEGSCGASGVTGPIYSYSHNGRDASVTGGVVYRGSQFPPEYQGVYFYGEYVQRWIRYLQFDSGGNVSSSVNFEPADGALDDPAVGEPVDFAVGPDGALYYVDFGWSPLENAASIRRIRYTAVDQPPVVSVAADSFSGPVPLTVTFSSSGSFDPEGQPLSFLWSFGDGSTSTEADPQHVYPVSGVYHARLTLSDGTNSTESDVLLISVGNAPVGTITQPEPDRLFRANDLIAFSATAFDVEDGALPPGAFSWRVLFHHDSHVHPTLGPLNGVTGGTFTIPSLGHDFSGDTSYEIILTATDSDGLPHRSSVFIWPEKVNLLVDSVPSGRSLSLDGIPAVTPFVKDVLVGFQYLIDAPNQIQNGVRYRFNSWSNSGAQSHFITMPVTDMVCSAVFDVVSSGLPSGLILAYGFATAGQSAVPDSSGNGYPAVALNGASWTATGRYGGAMDFVASDSYLQTANLPVPGGDFTMVGWIRLRSHQGFQSLVSVNGGLPGLEINLESDRLTVYANGSRRLISAQSVPIDTWTHWAVVFSGGELTVYLNGVADPETGAVIGPLEFSSCPLLLGADADSGCTGALNGFLDGWLDEFRFYHRALTSPEILTDMNTQSVFADETGAELTIRGVADGNYVLRYLGTPGRSYQLEATDSIDSSLWPPVANGVADAFGIFQLTNTPPPGASQQFYRLISAP